MTRHAPWDTRPCVEVGYFLFLASAFLCSPVVSQKVTVPSQPSYRRVRESASPQWRRPVMCPQQATAAPTSTLFLAAPATSALSVAISEGAGSVVPIILIERYVSQKYDTTLATVTRYLEIWPTPSVHTGEGMKKAVLEGVWGQGGQGGHLFFFLRRAAASVAGAAGVRFVPQAVRAHMVRGRTLDPVR